MQHYDNSQLYILIKW